ncbi:hypothetical protein EWM62_03390 [Mucilaginibacter terrigena]|uniref:Uncharacterized protein n=1 Tax=Mucilaginibacter terrigena TaxID=2492395 RepID=A0A4Q5LSF4_9SPHI|nr:hypothetical protein [Mucilaginibacter terrigena]RYU92491.1 hypothetical protein EWM62_03390 [Mucilaginibacter terrigena]
MKRSVLVLFLFTCLSGYSQSTINNYKYVIVPQKFAQFKEIDQYSLNRLTKALLEDKGFTVYFENTEIPGDVVNNMCQALNADLMQKSGMFTTEVTLVLKDCKGAVIYTSKAGKSREKDYKTAYNLALRDAFTSVAYTYSGPVTEAAPPTVAVKDPEKQMPVPVKPAETAPIVPVQAAKTAIDHPAGTLYAQAIANGYQLIDTTPKIVLTLLKTSAENYYIASNADASGVVLKKGDDWFFEYYKGNKLVSEKLLVKF